MIFKFSFIILCIINCNFSSNTTTETFCPVPETWNYEMSGCRSCSWQPECHGLSDKAIQCSLCNTRELCAEHPNDCDWFDHAGTHTCRIKHNDVYIGFLWFVILFTVLFFVFSIIHRILREFHEMHESVFYFARMVRWVEGRVDVAKGENFSQSLMRNITQYDPFMKFWLLDDSHYITVFEAYANWLFTFTYAAWQTIRIRLQREAGDYESNFWNDYAKSFILVSLPCMILYGISIVVEATEKTVELTAESKRTDDKCMVLDILYHIILVAGAVAFSVDLVILISHLYTPWFCIVWEQALWGWLVPTITGNFLTALKFLAAWEDQINKTDNRCIQILSRVFWKMKPVTLSKRMSNEFLSMEIGDGQELSAPYQWYLLGVNLHPDVAWDESHDTTPAEEIEQQRKALETSKRVVPHGMQSFDCKHLTEDHWLATADLEAAQCWNTELVDQKEKGMSQKEKLGSVASLGIMTNDSFMNLDESDGSEEGEAEKETVQLEDITEFDEPDDIDLENAGAGNKI